MDGLVFVIISIYLLLSHFVGRFSEKKGLSYLFGFLFSFFISPLIGYLVVSIRKEQVLKKDSKSCPYCYNKIHVRSVKCIHCNETLVKDVEVDEYQKRIDKEINQKKEQDFKDTILGYVIILDKIKKIFRVRKSVLISLICLIVIFSIILMIVSL